VKVSFDFDDTLLQTLPDEDAFSVENGENEALLEILRAHAAAGDDVFIVTSRYPDRFVLSNRTKVADFVAAHALPVKDIIFTAGRAKAPVLLALGIEKHFDDDREELALLPRHIQGVLVALHPAWLNRPS
jgi:hypothetical protein